MESNPVPNFGICAYDSVSSEGKSSDYSDDIVKEIVQNTKMR
jgi:hypothetical protein